MRSDISPGRQIAQACHGVRQFTEEHAAIDNAWFEKSNYIAVLNARNEDELLRILEKAREREIPFSTFIEPDLDNMITCIALAPGKESRRICSSLPLALKGM